MTDTNTRPYQRTHTLKKLKQTVMNPNMKETLKLIQIESYYLQIQQQQLTENK